MKRLRVILIMVVSILTTNDLSGQTPRQENNPRALPTTSDDSQSIDFDRARALLQKQRAGQSLTEEEGAYLKRAQTARQNRLKSQGASPQTPSILAHETTGLKPLTDMLAADRYKDEEGGLYGQGRNLPPESHRLAALVELSRIQSLRSDGQPDPNGSIGFVSISMSNATMEFSRFKQLADLGPTKSKHVAIVDCAQGGQAMAEWVQPNAPAWLEAERRIQVAKVSPQQIQVAWIKLANKGPSGDLQEHGRKLQRDTADVIRNAKSRFPNLRIVYLSSRIFGGFATNRLNPEPYAYESAFAVRWLIQDQVDGNKDLNFAVDRGEVKAPLLLWGPYLWADGTTPRQSDGLAYDRHDFATDGTHPSEIGRDKVAKKMLEFFSSDPFTKSWFAE